MVVAKNNIVIPRSQDLTVKVLTDPAHFEPRNILNIDESAKGKVILMDSSPTAQPNGMEIVISVADADVDTFRELSLKLFRYFKVKPKIHNLGEDSIEEKSVALSGDFWKLYDDGSGNTGSYYNRYNEIYDPCNQINHA